MEEASSTIVRRAMRIAVDWPARSRPETSEQWSPCQIVDISVTGVALKTATTMRTGEAIVIELAPEAAPMPLVLLGEVRNHRPDGTAGVELVSLSIDEELTLAAMLAVLTAADPFSVEPQL